MNACRAQVRVALDWFKKSSSCLLTHGRSKVRTAQDTSHEKDKAVVPGTCMDNTADQAGRSDKPKAQAVAHD